MLVAVFVIILVPAVVGTFWVAERAIYRPLCSRDYAPAVTDVEIELPFDGGLLSSGDSGVTMCVYANGESQSMQTVVAKNAAIVLDLFFTVLALGMPFLITYGVARRLP